MAGRKRSSSGAYANTVEKRWVRVGSFRGLRTTACILAVDQPLRHPPSKPSTSALSAAPGGITAHASEIAAVLWHGAVRRPAPILRLVTRSHSENPSEDPLPGDSRTAVHREVLRESANGRRAGVRDPLRFAGPWTRA